MLWYYEQRAFNPVLFGFLFTFIKVNLGGYNEPIHTKVYQKVFSLEYLTNEDIPEILCSDVYVHAHRYLTYAFLKIVIVARSRSILQIELKTDRIRKAHSTSEPRDVRAPEHIDIVYSVMNNMHTLSTVRHSVLYFDCIGFHSQCYKLAWGVQGTQKRIGITLHWSEMPSI